MPSVNIFAQQLQNNGSLMGGCDHGLPRTSPMLNNSTDSLNAASAPRIIQDSALSGINFTNLNAQNIQGGTIFASQIFIGNGAFSVDSTGAMIATRGTIAGWQIVGNTFKSTNNRIVLDAGNNDMQFSDGSNVRILIQT